MGSGGAGNAAKPMMAPGSSRYSMNQQQRPEPQTLAPRAFNNTGGSNASNGSGRRLGAGAVMKPEESSSDSDGGVQHMAPPMKVTNDQAMADVYGAPAQNS